MSTIHVKDVKRIKGPNVESLDRFVIAGQAPIRVTILPGLDLIIDGDKELCAEDVSGFVTVHFNRDSQGIGIGTIYFRLESRYYSCPETKSLLHGPTLCKLIAEYLHRNFKVDIGLGYLVEDWKVGGRISARGHSDGRGDILYYTGNRCK